MTAYYTTVERYERTLFKFDRRTFDPVKNPDHEIVLHYLRQQGTMRCRVFLHYQYPKVYPKPCRATWAYSQPFRHYVDSEFYSPKDVMLDIGCGNSPDRLLCNLHDMTGYGCDLIPPMDQFEELQKGFYQCDVVECIPFPYSDTSQFAIVSRRLFPYERQ